MACAGRSPCANSTVFVIFLGWKGQRWRQYAISNRLGLVLVHLHPIRKPPSPSFVVSLLHLSLSAFLTYLNFGTFLANIFASSVGFKKMLWWVCCIWVTCRLCNQMYFFFHMRFALALWMMWKVGGMWSFRLDFMLLAVVCECFFYYTKKKLIY